MEVIVNPMHPIVLNDFLELNDLINDHNEEIAIEAGNEGQLPVNQQGIQVNLNLPAAEADLMNLADHEMQHIQVVQINIMPEEIALDDIIDNGEGENENGNNLDVEQDINIDDMNLDNLVGPGEPCFPDMQAFLGNQNGEEIQDNQAEVEEQAGPEAPDEQAQLNVGMALTMGPTVDPVWAETHKTAEATRLWAQFFATGNHENVHVSLPSQWANFVTVMLLSPRFYEWAKDFITSRANECLKNDTGVVDFFIPRLCPSQIKCITYLDHNTETGAAGTKGALMEPTPQERLLEQEGGMTTPKKKDIGNNAPPVVDTCLRRSTKIKEVSGGFKKGTCSDRRCLQCSPDPPMLSNQVIRRLGAELAQLEEEELAEEMLMAKRVKTSPIGKKRATQNQKKKSVADGAGKKKKDKDDGKNL